MAGSADMEAPPCPRTRRLSRSCAAAEFREAMGHFATGVTVVTSVDADGEPVGTTARRGDLTVARTRRWSWSASTSAA